MTPSELNQLSELYTLYGYHPTEIEGVRVFEYKHGRYFGVDIIDEGNADTQKVVDAYAWQGYSTVVKTFESVDSAEEDLFKSFLQVEDRRSDNVRRYYDFVKDQLNVLPENAQYKYINGKFNLIHFDNDNVIDKLENDKEEPLPDVIMREIANALQSQFPMLTIIEASAGFGKTCTAYELLKAFSTRPEFKDTITLYIELSRNNEARIFKHILQNEIDRQFRNTVTYDVAEHQIQSGRVIVIIDGFDELLTKEVATQEDQVRDAESMLSTIFNLLNNRSQIIVTSRKTVMLNGEAFLELLGKRKNPFNVLRLTLSEPIIDDWLEPNQRNVLRRAGVTIENIANPAVLAYLHSLPEEELSRLTTESNIADVYMDFLCTRERKRQKLAMTTDTQLRIFKKLTRQMCELDIHSADRQFIKSLILDYNKALFSDYLRELDADTKPTLDELADTLTNHAIMDRKENGDVGFINDFVLGTLIGLNIEEKRFQQHRININDAITQTSALLAVMAYKEQLPQRRNALWKALFELKLPFDSTFAFLKDWYLVKELKEPLYKGFAIEDIKVKGLSFVSPAKMEGGLFNRCIFTNCKFQIESFCQTIFTDCKFYNCQWTTDTNQKEFEMIYMAGCEADNNFCDLLTSYIETSDDMVEEEVNLEASILSLFVGGKITGMRRLISIKEELADFSEKQINNTLNKLKKEGYINVNGGNCFIRKEGISYYCKNFQ